MPPIALITDYGTRDFYVGALKGVIASIAHATTVIDVTHDIEPHNVLHGAFVLRQVWPSFPAGTIHVVVVDPGVGTGRRILLGQYAGQLVIAPDNGLITLLHREFTAEALHVVENRRYFLSNPSSTFHGRDIMAPVAAHLANGVLPRDIGGTPDRLEILPVSHRAGSSGGVLSGIALHVDRFGTIVTNIHRDQIGSVERATVCVNGTDLGAIVSTFGDVATQEPLALLGAGDYLEIAVNCGRAIDRFGPMTAVRVEVR